jgi:hypothetical protein
MARQVHQLGREIPLATTEIADMVTAGARMEVPTEQLAAYTCTAAMMAIAFDAVPAHIAEQMGKVGKNFRIPLTDIGALADSINYLDDNAISKGDEIIDVLNRISGVVSTVAMSAKDAAALSSTLLTLGERPETPPPPSTPSCRSSPQPPRGRRSSRTPSRDRPGQRPDPGRHVQGCHRHPDQRHRRHPQAARGQAWASWWSWWDWSTATPWPSWSPSPRN